MFKFITAVMIGFVIGYFLRGWEEGRHLSAQDWEEEIPPEAKVGGKEK